MDTYIRSGKKFEYVGSAGALIGLFILFFMLISHEISKSTVLAFDHQAIALIQSWINPRLTNWMLGITFLGSVNWIAILVVGGGVVLFIKKKRSLGLFFLLSSGVGALFNLLLKWLFKRERPDILPLISEEGYSFPSGHSMGSFIFYGALAYVIIHLVHQKSWKWIATILNGLIILFIGITRVYLGVHYPSDIVGGFFAGAAWLLACIILFRYYEYRHNL